MAGAIKVLFVCVHNSARSQMAEAFLRELGKEDFKVESAGLEPGTLNPVVVEAMKEEGIDISDNKTKSVFDLFREGRIYDFVIAVCDKEAAERCPIFPGVCTRLNWSFPDPAAVRGNPDEKLAATRTIRDSIKKSVADWIAEVDPNPAGREGN